MTVTLSAAQELNSVIGDGDLCAWRPTRGVIWVQSRNPKHTRRLVQRTDSRQVVCGVAGGYLRTFEFTGKTLAWAQRLICRYTGWSDLQLEADRHRGQTAPLAPGREIAACPRS